MHFSTEPSDISTNGFTAKGGEAAPEQQPAEAPDDDDTLLVQETLSEVCHDVNNTLAIISGNAQLLKEVARAGEMGDPFVEPLEDIQTARAEISEALDRLEHVRQRLDSPSQKNEMR